MLKPFAFNSTAADSPEGRNWRVFDEASKTIVRTDLVFVNPISAVAVTRGVFTLYGPIVFYSITLSVPNTDGWTTTGYIDLPYSAVNDGTSFTAPHIGTCFNNPVEGIMGSCYISGVANPNRLNFSFGYTNSSGVTTTPTITGWYYRN